MKHLACVAIAFLAGLPCVVQAAGAGDLVVGLGWPFVSPNGSSDPLQVTVMGNAQSLAGSSTKTHESEQPLIAISYFLTDHISWDFGLGVPPTVRLDGAGTLAGLGELGSARYNAPAFLLRYSFGEKTDAWRPSVALGLSYVWYSRIQLAPAIATGQFLASAAPGNALVGPTTAKLDSTFAPVVSIGSSYEFSPRWLAGLAVTYAPVNGKTTLTTNAPVGTVVSVEKYRMNNVTTLLSIGYVF